MVKHMIGGMLVLLLIAGGGFGLWWYNQSRVIEQVRSMPIQDVDLSQLTDGTYTGSFTYNGRTVEVAVQVVDRQIVQIEVTKNRDSERAKAAEGVISSVLAAQSPNVDAVTGVTTSSKAILKAIEDALTGGGS